MGGYAVRIPADYQPHLDGWRPAPQPAPMEVLLRWEVPFAYPAALTRISEGMDGGWLALHLPAHDAPEEQELTVAEVWHRVRYGSGGSVLNPRG